MTAPNEEAAALLQLAEKDLKAFIVLNKAAEVDASTVCFHAQQYVEKAMKAILVTNGVVFRRTHDLVKLADFLRETGVTPPVNDEELKKLNPFAVVFRYEHMDIETVTREEAETIVETTRRWVKKTIG
jgi:HEPN domain-containing protein